MRFWDHVPVKCVDHTSPFMDGDCLIVGNLVSLPCAKTAWMVEIQLGTTPGFRLEQHASLEHRLLSVGLGPWLLRLALPMLTVAYAHTRIFMLYTTIQYTSIDPR